jgi:hypothetical protein
MPYKNPTPEQKEKMRMWSRNWMRRNKERHHARRQIPAIRQRELRMQRLRKFKLTWASVQALYEAQHGCCAICAQVFADAFSGHIDHNHETGKVRGLLCNNCNTGLGMFGESLTSLAQAITYLEKHR